MSTKLESARQAPVLCINLGVLGFSWKQFYNYVYIQLAVHNSTHRAKMSGAAVLQFMCTREAFIIQTLLLSLLFAISFILQAFNFSFLFFWSVQGLDRLSQAAYKKKKKISTRLDQIILND